MANNMISHLCFFVVFAFSCKTLIEAHNNGGFSVQVFRHESRNSPFHKSNELYKHLFHSSPQNAPTTRVIPNNVDYLMKLTLGTPPVSIYGLIDTGSDLVWTQCKPCRGCFKQKNPMFNPLKSKTYRDIQCKSKQCTSFLDISPYCSSQNLCSYTYGYGDGSITKGVLATETVTFSSTKGEQVIKDILFGCGHNDTGIFNENDMGIIGLGRGPLSLVSQMGTHYGSRSFSQCLVPLDVKSNISGTISFGADSEVSGEGVVTTPLVVGEKGVMSSFYLVTLKGLSVGNKFISFDSSKRRRLSKGNIIIDSGTPLTYIPQKLYDGLVGELKTQIKQKPVEDPGNALCYGSNITLQVPILTAHFDGADVPLMPAQTFFVAEKGVFCFAMKGTSDDGGYIFGSYAQSNILIGFDLDRKIVSFKPTDCTKQYQFTKDRIAMYPSHIDD